MVYAQQRLIAGLAFAGALMAAGQWCSPERLVVSGDTLYISCATGRTAALNLATGQVTQSVKPPAPPPYRLNQFKNEVLLRGAVIALPREPISAALTPDGKLLLVANALPVGPSNKGPVAAEVTLIDAAARKVSGHIALPNGSTALRQIRLSPNGQIAAVTHLVGRWFMPTTQLDRGWIQTNAVTLIDVPGRKRMATVLLDDVDRGAANPWAVAWTADGGKLCVTHAGTHELSIIDASAMFQRIASAKSDPTDDLAFMVGIRRRVQLAGNGPRALAIAGSRAYVASYFTDTIEELDLDAAQPVARTIATLSHLQPDRRRKGEMLFNDGTVAFQSWLSCASCHSPDARVDGLNWDLLNDGIGNPNNVKSLLLSHRTPPVMSHAVRENAETAVRAGLRFILFTDRPEADAVAIDEYLKSLKPQPSPYLVNGKLSAAAQRGKQIFFDAKVACATCHPAGLFTTLKSYDVGSGGDFDTPTLYELYRTGPYMHDGSVVTLKQLVTTANPKDKHGRTSQLTPARIDDLVAYLLSL